MKKIVAAMSCLICTFLVFSNSSFAFERSSLKGEELFTRTNLKARGRTVFFHNMTKEKDIIPVGSKVLIKGTSSKTIKFKLIGEEKTYRLTDRPNVYGKYFVKNINEIGLSAVSAKAKAAIDGMSIYTGMTKDEAFTSKGCPAYIGHGIKSWGHTLDEVMQSDTWYYNEDTRRRSMIVEFKNGKVSNIKNR